MSDNAIAGNNGVPVTFATKEVAGVHTPLFSLDAASLAALENINVVSSGVVALDAPTLAALETINATTGGLTDTQLRASALPISGQVSLDSASLVALENINVTNFTDNGLTDAQLRASALPTTNQVLADLQASINTLNETMLVYLGAIFEKMPRLQANDRVMCDLSETSLATISTVTALTTLTTANDLLRLQGLGSSTINVTKAADAIPVHLSNVGALHLYDKIIVS